MGGGDGHQVTAPPQPQFQRNLNLRRLVLTMLFRPSDGPPHGGGRGGLQGVGGIARGGGYQSRDHHPNFNVREAWVLVTLHPVLLTPGDRTVLTAFAFRSFPPWP